MTPERYRQVKSLFQLVLDQPPNERAAFLDRACGADRELYSQVRGLLKSDYTSDDFLEKPAVTPISKVLAEVAAEGTDAMPGQIGPYTILKQLGSGGMGAVYLAVRSDQTFTKQVAIKVIHRGMESDRILQRFRRERQIIASLDHPNIARLLDGGATSDGRPYIVMEYVDGVPITQWCDERRLNTKQRLAIFLQVCDAVQYAHQNLIIHRDIKPGNILVRADNTAKLLDFGIAKLMNPDIAAPVIDNTATSMRMMTPQYASPEQLRGEAVTTASDVYLLGIVLYELLASHRPYEVKDNAALEAMRAYSQGEPQKPSEAIFRPAQGAMNNVINVSALRDGNPALLLKELQGDVDAIMLKALRRNPAERYQSTAQFAEDIRNYLQQLPISAQPDNPAYRIGLFFRRNMRLAFAAGGGILLLLCITLLAVWQAARANKERQRAEIRLSEVRKMSGAVLFDVQDAIAPLPGATPARRLIVNKALAYLSNMSKGADSALIREAAAGYIRVGDAQGNPLLANLGDTAGAMASYRTAETMLAGLYQKDPKNRQLADELAGAEEALAEVSAWTGDTAEAEARLRRAAALREKGNAPAEIRAATYHRLAAAMADSGAAAEALELSKKAHQLAETVKGPEAVRQQALSHGRVGAVLFRTGDQNGAAGAYRTALNLYQQLAAAAPHSAQAKRELSFALEEMAVVHAADAGAYYRQSLQLRRELAANDPQNLEARRDLANALLKQGSVEDALESFRQILELDPASIVARRDLALAWERQGNARIQGNQFTEAVNSYRQFLAAARDGLQRQPASSFGKHLLASAHLRLAEALPKANDPSGGAASAREAIAILNALLEKEPENRRFRRDRAMAQWKLGRALMEGKAWREAQTELEEAQRLSPSAAIAAEIEICRKAGNL